MQLKPIVKKENEQLLTLDLSQFLPDSQKMVELDISKWLFQGLLLKEKDFRQHVKNEDWSVYNEKLVRLYTSSDAIVAPWAYMLVAHELSKVEAFVCVGTVQELLHEYIQDQLRAFDWSKFTDKTVLVKGCGDQAIDHWAYTQAALYLGKHVRRLHYGEACSFVPVFKRARPN